MQPAPALVFDMDQESAKVIGETAHDQRAETGRQSMTVFGKDHAPTTT
jgi:hypothetical protein